MSGSARAVEERKTLAPLTELTKDSPHEYPLLAWAVVICILDAIPGVFLLSEYTCTTPWYLGKYFG